LASSITIEKVDAAYGAVRVLEEVTVDAKPGETVVLLGTNGNGKSTLIKCIMGMVTPEAGEVILERDGTRIDLTRLSTEEIVNLGIALVPEGRRLFPKLTVEENLLLGAYRKAARADIARNLAFAWDAFPALRTRRRQLAGSMSGGEQQMLAVARALMSSPRLLLIDEPSVGLAPILVQQVFALVRDLRDRGVTVLMIEQNAKRALETSDYGMVLQQGRLALAGTASEVLDHPEIGHLFLGGVIHAAGG
jgi:branched-chain amino acid transport system ATP-binding protein